MFGCAPSLRLRPNSLDAQRAASVCRIPDTRGVSKTGGCAVLKVGIAIAAFVVSAAIGVFATPTTPSASVAVRPVLVTPADPTSETYDVGREVAEELSGYEELFEILD